MSDRAEEIPNAWNDTDSQPVGLNEADQIRLLVGEATEKTARIAALEAERNKWQQEAINAIHRTGEISDEKLAVIVELAAARAEVDRLKAEADQAHHDWQSLTALFDSTTTELVAQRDAALGQRDITMEALTELNAALTEWASARLVTTDAPVADVRKDATFAEKLSRLASAEQALMALSPPIGGATG